MARPHKDVRFLKNVDLRIPLTVEQKRLIQEAASLDQADMAAWVRPLLIQAAKDRVARRKIGKNRPDESGG